MSSNKCFFRLSIFSVEKIFIFCVAFLQKSPKFLRSLSSNCQESPVRILPPFSTSLIESPNRYSTASNLNPMENSCAPALMITCPGMVSIPLMTISRFVEFVFESIKSTIPFGNTVDGMSVAVLFSSIQKL